MEREEKKRHYHGGVLGETDGHPPVGVIGRDGETDLVVPFQIFPLGVVGAIHLERVARHGIFPFASAKCRTLVNVATAARAASSAVVVVMMIDARLDALALVGVDLGCRWRFYFGRVKESFQRKSCERWENKNKNAAVPRKVMTVTPRWSPLPWYFNSSGL